MDFVNWLKGKSTTTACACLVGFCLLLSTQGISLGHFGNGTGVSFISALATFAGFWAAKDWNKHSTIDQVQKSTASVDASNAKRPDA